MTSEVDPAGLQVGTGAEDGPGPSSHPAAARGWRVRGGTVAVDGPVVMGIVNLTPDSFSDGGLFPDLAAAVDHAHRLVEEGAAILDVGGESTRPGAHAVPEDEELARVIPFIEAVAGDLGVPVSVDTRKASVARAALDAGAAVVNDVSGFRFDPDLARVTAEAGAGAVVMHMRGEPHTMGGLTGYEDVSRDVAGDLRSSVARVLEAGVDRASVVVDPGLGFAKTPEETVRLLANLGPVLGMGFPVLVGPSRKRFLSEGGALTPRERVHGTVAACVVAYLGGARIFRVHDVAPVVQALEIARVLHQAQEEEEGDEIR